MDELDLSSEREQLARDRAIAAARTGKGLKVTGECHYCGEACPRQFCDVECRDQYEVEQRAKRRNGWPS